MSRHVVFGTGQVGSHLVDQLLGSGHLVTAASRHGRRQFAGATNVAGDATDPAFTRAVCGGADVVYFCLDAPDYHRWPEQFPPLQRGVLAGAETAGARLVVLENLYGYGRVDGRELHESLPLAATSAKGRTRAVMTGELLDAHARGSVEIAIGRASDYFGPGAIHSALGELVFGAAVRHKTAQVMGDPDRAHSYSYTPDVASGLATLGCDARASGQVWHLPIAETWTTREIIDHVYALAGATSRLFAARRTTLTLYGVIKPAMREYLHTLYQFSDDWQVSDSRFRSTFGDQSTPLASALATTLAWYSQGLQRDGAAVGVGSSHDRRPR
ncbi:MAG: NAD(P)H-binding protein [Acidimicrobiia bacterium]